MSTDGSDIEKRAREALVQGQFEFAVDLYSHAIDLTPTQSELYADRAQAYFKLNSFLCALDDTNRAIELDPTMVKAYMQKGTACMKLEDYETAKIAFQSGAVLAPANFRFKKFIKECDSQISALTSTTYGGDQRKTFNYNNSDLGGDHYSQDMDLNLSYSELNKLHDFNMFIASLSNSSADPPTVSTVSEASTSNSNAAQADVPVAKSEFMHEFYQKPEEVVVTIYAKDIPASSVVVIFGEQIFGVTIDIPGEDRYFLSPWLFGKIIAEKCSYEVLSTKIEIRLAKAKAIKWTSLGYTKKDAGVQKMNASTSVQRPSYPSSKQKI